MSASPPSLTSLLADAGAPVTRVLCTGGVVWVHAVGGEWRPSHARDDEWVTPGCDLATVDRWLARRGVRPVALATPAGDGAGFAPEPLLLASAAGALGWRPPLERLAADPAYARLAVRTRPVLDAGEHHALDAIARYAQAAASAARVARLHDAASLATVAAAPGLFVAVDALAGAGLRTLDAAVALATRAFGPTFGPTRRVPRGARGARGARAQHPVEASVPARVAALPGAPATLRATLLEVWAAHGAHAAVRRRALLHHASAALGPPAVCVRRLRTPVGPAWAVHAPVEHATPRHPHGVDAFEAAWALATDAWRALTLVSYAVLGEWTFD